MNLAYNAGRLAQVAQEMGLRLVVLFGSRAKGSPPPTLDSDVDIAVLGMPDARYRDGFEALYEVFPDHPLDVVRLESADPLLRQEIMHRSVLLWGDPTLFSEYRAYAYRDFTDAADLFALERALFAKKMKRLEEELRDSS
jgi:predicted nucleotidyltransferase